MKENGIVLHKTNVKNLLQELREYNYSSDDNFLIDISKITISLSQIDKELQDLPFCFAYQKFINLQVFICISSYIYLFSYIMYNYF